MKRVFIICGIGIFAVLMTFAVWNPFAKETRKDAAAPFEPRDHVTLSDEKFEAARIEIGTAQRRLLGPYRTVAGRIEYDATRHVQVKSPFDGLIRTIKVKVGDRVEEGQILAIVESAELGERRADVLSQEANLKLAVNTHAWWHAVQENLDELLARLKRPQEMAELENEFSDKVLGDYREKIVTTYSQMQLAEKFQKKIGPISGTGALPVNKELEIRSARDTTAARYAAECEQAKFDVKQKHLTAENAVHDAENRLAIAKQRLLNLVNPPEGTEVKIDPTESLSTWPVRATFAATVEEILLSPKERVQMAEGMFQLADTSRLWVQADIRERDWSALSTKPGQRVSIQTEALPGETLEAKVSFIGRTVSQDTRAVPLIAEIDNSAGTLRPGLFVRVLIPTGEPTEYLTVPEAAVTSNEQRTFVFVETGPRQFHSRDVIVGSKIDKWIEIKSGLDIGERIVTKGTAILKAELLLEPEE